MSGVPDSPGAWLLTAARRRAIDASRHRQMAERKHQEIARGLDEATERHVEALEASLDDFVGDDLLRLMFITCHPVLTPDARVALTLRLVGGLNTDEIARAFLAQGSTIAQRISRAKRTLAEARVPFELPARDELAGRVASVLEVIYLVFNEGYSATAGEDLVRPALCDDALRLGRILAELLPNESEVHGLVSLMEIQASRLRARVNAAGEPVLLLEQDRSRWDRLLIRRGLAALERASVAGRALGTYALQASIAACHARARTAAETDWIRIAALYEALAKVSPSPVVELNRAVAVMMAFGAEVGIALVDALIASETLDGYHLVHAVRGDMLVKLGRPREARAEFERAATLTRNAREVALMRARAAACVWAEPFGA